MKNYELSLVFISTLSEEEKVANLEKVKELIARFGGEVTCLLYTSPSPRDA